MRAAPPARAGIDGRARIRSGGRRVVATASERRGAFMARDEMEIDGLRIAFERAGRGPPVILLRGYVGDGRSTWQPQLESLCDEYTVVAWDAPGVGRSSDPPEWCRLRTTPTASPGSSRRSTWGDRTSSGCRSAAGSLPAAVVEQRLRQVVEMADRPPGEFVGAVAPTLSRTARRPRSWASSSRTPWSFVRRASARWRAPSQRRTSARSCRTSPCRRSSCTATGTCARRA
jgi:hypothetical protein